MYRGYLGIHAVDDFNILSVSDGGSRIDVLKHHALII